MYILNSFFAGSSSLFVSINSNNEYIATASSDGNISIRSIKGFQDLINSSVKPQELTNSNSNDSSNLSESSENFKSNSTINILDTEKENVESLNNKTIPLRKIDQSPVLDSLKLEESQKIINIVGVRSRSKITSLKYAHLNSNSNLLVAVYKNGEVYIISDPHDPAKCEVKKIFKHVKGLLLDFCWSADDQLLAFTSMNNEVIIYDVIYGKILSTLHLHEYNELPHSKENSHLNSSSTPNSHTNTNSTESINNDNNNNNNNNNNKSIDNPSMPIKGICFDRIHNNELLTLGDDKILNIVQYNLIDDPIEGRKFNYKIIQKMDRLINSAKLNKATIRKLSWSIDDKVFCCPNTSKSKTTRVSLITNSSSSEKSPKFSVWKELIGDGFKCTMSSFSPCCYKDKNNKNSSIYILATISPDSALAIWRSDQSQPVYLTLNLSPQPIQDLDWSTDGTMLFATTTSGNLLIAVFDKNEFGEVVEENFALLSNLDKRTQDLQSLEIKKMIAWKEAIKNKKLVIPNENLPGKSNFKDEGKIELKELQNGSTSKDLTTTNVNVPAINKKKKNNKILPIALSNSGSPSPSPVVKPTPDKKEKELLKKSTDKQISNSKKELSKITTNTNTPTTTASNKKSVNKTNIKKRPISSTDFDAPSTSVPKDLNNKVTKMMKKDETQEPTLKKKREVEPSEFIGSVAINPQTSFSNIRIAIPKVRITLKYALIEDDSLFLEVKNGNGHETQPSRIALVKQISKDSKKQIFVDFLSQKVHIITGSIYFWAVSTTNGQIITYTESGSRVLPTIVLGSPLSFLEMKDNYLMAVTSIGELYAWNLSERCAIFKPSSLYPLLHPIYSSSNITNGPNSNQANGKANTNASMNDLNGINGSQLNGSNTGSILSNNSGNNSGAVDQNGIIFVNGELLTRSENLTMCSITSGGLPIVTLSNGNGYLFNKEMCSWSLISDSWWAFGSQYWDSTRTFNSQISGEAEGLLDYLETHTNEEILRKGKTKFFNKISKVMLMREGYENLETVISLNHLENKINLYLYLNDFKNFKTFLILYAKRLSELNLKNRLIELFQNLFIDMDGEICGIKKKNLLEDLILSCSKHREVQRILIQYSESIGLLDNDLL